MQWEKKKKLNEWSSLTTIATFVKKEMEVGIMIARQPSFGVDTGMENRSNPIKEEHSELGNTTEKQNGNKSK